MTANELIKYLAYTDNNINLTIIKTEEYKRLRKIERLAKTIIQDKKMQNLKKTLDKP